MILSITDLKKELLIFLTRQDFSDKEKEILINFAYKIKVTNFTSLIDHVINKNKKVFYFSRPEENLTFLAFNNILSLNIKGENKFSKLGEKISTITPNIIRNLNKDSSDKFPLFIGGTKFCAGKNSDEWKDFAENDWFIPQFLFYRKDEDYWIILNVIINKNDHFNEQVNCLLEPIEKLNNSEFLPHDDNSRIKVYTVEREREDWNKLISNALSKIEEGLFRKVVLSRRIIASIKNLPLFIKVLRKLEGNYQNCTIFLFRSENSILFGATPEQLLKSRENLLEFDALAGSAKRGENAIEDNIIADSLLRDKKNSEEHNHVIEFIKVASSKYIRNFRQSDTGIKKFSNIQHIFTPLKAELKSPDQIYNLVDEIFPTPAICGYPKETSLCYIIENESFDRGLFSGILGFISPGEMDLVVAIRSALLKDNKLYIYAGCGIVNGSDPISEFEETEIKMKPILSLFNNED